MALADEVFDEMLASFTKYLWALTGKLVDEPLRLLLYEKTIESAVAKRDQFDGDTPERMKGWLTAMMRNDAIDVIRHRGRRPEEISVEDLPGAPSATETLMAGLRQRATGEQTRQARLIDLMRALRMLPEADRVCLVLYLMEDLTVPEIAQRLDRPESTVKKACQRAARRVREHLGLPVS